MTEFRCACGSAEYEIVLEGRTSRLAVVNYEFRIAICRDCGLGATIPRPNVEQYQDGYSLSTDEGRFTGSARDGWSEPLARFVQERIPGGRFLDIGCHVGNLVAAASAAGFEAEGIDADPVATAYGASLGRPIRCATLEAVTGGFQVIVVNHVLEHIGDLAGFLHSVERLLAPGGMLFVFVPNRRGLMARAMGANWIGWFPNQHVWHFDRHSLLALFKRETNLSVAACTTKGVIEPPSVGARGMVKKVLTRGSRIAGWGDQIEAIFQRQAN